jgi:Xaa-Pro aminopeptidase
MRTSDSSLKPEFFDEKLSLVLRAMKELEIDSWLIFSREGNEDPIASDLKLGSLTWRSAGILDADGTRTALVGSFEVETVKQRVGFYEKIYGYENEGASPKLYELIDKRKPKKIAVNTSHDFGLADGLSSGMREYLVRSLKEYGDKLVSAEDLIIAFRAKLLPKEIDLVKKSIAKCEQIFKTAEEDFIKVGRKDSEIHHSMKKRVHELGLETAWEAEMCPSVTIGTNPPGHVAYHNDVLENGDFLRVDFGVRFEGYCSDIQRDYFVGNKPIPREVKKMFETARRANDASLSALKPGVDGYIVDKASRDVVISSGYPEFMHATGHVLGRTTHEIGPLLGPRWPNRYGKAADKKVQSDMIFTVEPSVQGQFGTCNLEQDVLVTDRGVTSLSKTQDDILQIGQ